MEPRMNTTMRVLIDKLVAQEADIKFERDNCILLEHYIRVNETEKAPDKVMIVTPSDRIGGVYYYYVRTGASKELLRLNSDKVLEMYEEYIKEAK